MPTNATSRVKRRPTRHRGCPEPVLVSSSLRRSIFLLLLSCAPASAAVYLNDAVIDEAANIPPLAAEPWISMGRVFHLTQSPNGFVVVEVNRLTPSSTFELIYQSIAGAYALCQVTSGEELTYLNISSKPTLGGFGGGNTLTLNSGQEAYIGYWSQRGGKPVAAPAADDIFGWAKVTNTAGNLIVTSSASADTGIIVGTTQAIPEPASAILGSAAALLLLRRKRYHHSPGNPISAPSHSFRLIKATRTP